MGSKSLLDLLCDEDIGTGVPTALNPVGYRANSLVRLRWGGRPDVEWLAWAGQRGLLVLSCNKKMLLVPDERDTIIRENVGIVFLNNGEEHPARVLKLLLNKWNDLELLDQSEPRPFAKFLSMNGRLTDQYRYFRL
jgi:hypothetical protein